MWVQKLQIHKLVIVGFIVDVVAFTNKLFAESNSFTICAWLGPHPFLATIDPDFIEKILTSSDLISKQEISYKPLRRTFGDGLITSSALRWQLHRKLLNPAFNHKVILGFIPVFNSAARALCIYLDSIESSGE